MYRNNDVDNLITIIINNIWNEVIQSRKFYSTFIQAYIYRANK